MQEVINLKNQRNTITIYNTTTRFHTDVHTNGQIKAASSHLSSLQETGSILDSEMESHHKDIL